MAQPNRMYVHRARSTLVSQHLVLDHATWHDSEHLRHASSTRQTHTHDVYHVVLVHSGSGSFLGPAGPIAVQAPWLVLCSPGVPHSFQGAPGDDSIYSECTFFGVDLRNMPLRLSWPRLLAERFSQACPVPASGPCPPRLAQQLDAHIADLVDCGQRVDLAINGLASGLLDAVLFSIFRHLVASQQQVDDPLAQARDILDARVDDPPSLDALAAAVGMSVKHLGRAFTRRYGLAPGRYRQRAAMQHAASLLRASNASIADVAAELGFADPKYFIRIFGQVHGISPGAFRRQQRDL